MPRRVRFSRITQYPWCDACNLQNGGCIKSSEALVSSHPGYPCQNRSTGQTMACTSEQCSVGNAFQYFDNPLLTKRQYTGTPSVFPPSHGPYQYGFPQRDSSSRARLFMPWRGIYL